MHCAAIFVIDSRFIMFTVTPFCAYKDNHTLLQAAFFTAQSGHRMMDDELMAKVLSMLDFLFQFLWRCFFWFPMSTLGTRPWKLRLSVADAGLQRVSGSGSFQDLRSQAGAWEQAHLEK